MICQLTTIGGVCGKNGMLNEVFQIRVRILRKGKRGVKHLFRKVRRLALRGRTPGPSPEQPDIKSGQWIEVRTIEEIAATLDDGEKLGGCLFIDEMGEYCGRRYRVLKEVESFYDETKNRMCRAKNMFLLEGVRCSGRQRLYTVDCDRSCFFFWHRDWLQGIDAGGSDR
jgi:hypothetical protein